MEEERRTTLAEMTRAPHGAPDCAIISLHDILATRERRLDAKHYNLDGQKAKRRVLNCKFQKLALNSKTGFASVWHRPRFRRIFVEEGIPIFTASQSRQHKPIPRKFVSEKTDTNLDRLYLKKGQITMTCSGNIGLVALVTNTLKSKLFSHDLMRIDCHDKLDTGYVYTFLKTKTGRAYVTTSKYGSVVSHIEPKHLTSVLIPDPPAEFKSRISKRANRVHALRDDANVLLDHSNALLFNELKMRRLEEIKPKSSGGPAWFVVPRADLGSRLDGSYYLPVIGKIISEIDGAKCQVTTLGDKKVSNAIILPGRFKRTYVKSSLGIPFLGGRDILQYDHPDIKHLSLSKHKERIDSELLLQENMILVTCSGTIGNVILCPKYYDGWSASQHVIRIIPSKAINPGYLYAYLASDYGRELIRRYSYGSVVDEVTDDQVSNIPIPLPDRKVMDKVGNPVLEANKKRDAAYNIEKDTIQMVENMIDENQI